MKSKTYYAILTTITEGNKVDGKVIRKQIMFNQSENDVARARWFKEPFVVQSSNELTTVEDMEWETGLKFIWQNFGDGSGGYIPVGGK